MTGDRYRVIEMPEFSFLLIQAGDGGIRTGWLTFGSEHLEGARHAPRLLPALTDRLRSYFRGEAVRFDDVPLPRGGPFQRACWRAARAIPRGARLTYAELAAAAGSPRAARAAGQAMRHNPQPVITPCHRVVATGGGLGGFSGCIGEQTPGVRTKRLLLELENPSDRIGVSESDSGLKYDGSLNRTSGAGTT